ncbi:hypothetical protein M0813_25625 [Anaeramoeba flamelloides]|uniref:Calponin-homology (CH) domain-containing protein n=1 Tax=Anaeramoeba flamelloides TaxID=1746091 RepID=A0ABQ8Y4D8_9EUKA|nr:hypothetical protein M0813_25625 [Anaeramoeba flamelloides]
MENKNEHTPYQARRKKTFLLNFEKEKKKIVYRFRKILNDNMLTEKQIFDPQGVCLCKFLNMIAPQPKFLITYTKMEEVQRFENLNEFRKTLTEFYQFDSTELFDSADLHKKKKHSVVLLTKALTKLCSIYESEGKRIQVPQQVRKIWLITGSQEQIFSEIKGVAGVYPNPHFPSDVKVQLKKDYPKMEMKSILYTDYKTTKKKIKIKADLELQQEFEKNEKITKTRNKFLNFENSSNYFSSRSLQKISDMIKNFDGNDLEGEIQKKYPQDFQKKYHFLDSFFIYNTLEEWKSLDLSQLPQQDLGSFLLIQEKYYQNWKKAIKDCILKKNSHQIFLENPDNFEKIKASLEFNRKEVSIILKTIGKINIFTKLNNYLDEEKKEEEKEEKEEEEEEKEKYNDNANDNRKESNLGKLTVSHDLIIFKSNWGKNLIISKDPIDNMSFTLTDNLTNKKVKLFVKDQNTKLSLLFMLMIYNQSRGKDKRIGNNFKINNFNVKELDVSTLPPFLDSNDQVVRKSKIQMQIEKNTPKYENREQRKELISQLSKEKNPTIKYSIYLIEENFIPLDPAFLKITESGIILGSLGSEAIQMKFADDFKIYRFKKNHQIIRFILFGGENKIEKYIYIPKKIEARFIGEAIKHYQRLWRKKQRAKESKVRRSQDKILDTKGCCGKF